MKPIHWIALLFVFIGTFSFTQEQNSQKKLNDLLQACAQDPRDTSSVKKYIGLSLSNRGDSLIAFTFVQKGIALGNDLKFKKGLADAFTIRAYLLRLHNGKLDEIESDLFKSRDYYQTLKDEQGEIKIYHQLFELYTDFKLTDKAIGLFELVLEDKSDNTLYLFHMNGILGSFLKETGQFQKATEYLSRSILYFPEISKPSSKDSSSQFINLRHLGVSYRYLDQADSAYLYFDKGLDLAMKLRDSLKIGSCYNSMAITYQRFKDYESALHYYQLSLEYKKTSTSRSRKASTLTNIATTHFELNNIQKAKEYIEKALGTCDGKCNDRRNRHVFRAAGEIYGRLGDFKKAFRFYQELIILRDSADNRESGKIAQELEARYQNEKNNIIQEKLNAELEATNLREQQKEDQIKQQTLLLFIFSGVGILLAILITFIYRANIKRKKVNNELLIKNTKIENQHNKIQFQNEQLGQKNKEILDSINYAKRIQNAILPSVGNIKSIFPESFVLYQPKDIVAGDFYWLETVASNVSRVPSGDQSSQATDHNPQGTVLIAAADCTGHGVPGAMVSVVCNNGLNRSVREFGLTEPGKILDKTRELVIQEFEKSEEEVKDGMDIALISLEQQQEQEHTARGNTENQSLALNSRSKLSYAGAHNPLWIIRNGAEEVEEVKANKQPIGKFDHPEPYKTHKKELFEGDTIYIFTDGFSDQFGGNSGKAGGKKLKSTNLKKLLLSIQNLNMQEQKAKLTEFFNDWKGELEQLDDICIIGIRF